MKTHKRGFTIILVILVIAILGIEIAALSQVSMMAAAETNREYFEACHRNALLSAAAYLGAHRGQLTDQPQTLDVSAIHPQALCTILRLVPADSAATFQIETTCRYRNASIARRHIIP